MFGDTITLTVAGNAKVLNKINQDNYGSEYYLRSSTEMFRLRIRHTQSTKAGQPVTDRHNVEFTQTIFADGDDDQIVDKAYFVMEQFQNEPSVALMAALATWATASTNAALVKLTNLES
jgi:hypothetical protein